MIKNELVFRQELEKANGFWLTGKVEEKEKYPVEREEAETIFGGLKLKKVLMLTGPRRVGKSILIKHLISRLLGAGVKPRNVLFYSLEDPYLKLYCDSLMKDVFDYWLENVAEEGDKYVFFDEVHFADEWYKWLKIIYDRHKEVTIVVSGSSSLVLYREADKYLRGRYVYHELWPLNFKQFLKLSGKQPEEFRLDVISADKLLGKYKNDFRQYMLVGGFPEFFEINETKTWFQILKSSVSSKAIYEDIATTYKIRNLKILEQILLFIIANQSKILSYEKINEVAGLKHEILLNYIEYLKSSYLTAEVLKFAKNVKEQLKSKKKFLCVDQGLRNALLKDFEVKENNEGLIAENVVGMHLYTYASAKDKRLFYYKTNGDVDFVVKGAKTVLVEVKYRKNITDKDVKKVEAEMRKAGCSKACIVTKDNFKLVKASSGKLVLVPALIFCMFLEKFI